MKQNKSHEAMFYEKQEHLKVQCHLCPHNCVILPGKKGICKVRENQGGTLYSLVYGLPCTVATDPIEKKPLFHFLPGTRAYSIATAGCNFHCRWCQNWEISQHGPEEVPSFEMSPEEVVEDAIRKNSQSIAYTYVEPSVFYEYMLDTAKLARKKGLKNVMVSNGYINATPAKKLFKYMDAINIDIKGFTEEFYKEYCGGELKPVLETAKQAKRSGVWVEITMLIVPTINDDMETIKKMCQWLKKELGTDTPLHFSRFFPMYKMTHLEPTPIDTLLEAKRTAEETGIKYVYVGNTHSGEGENTKCPKCGKEIIGRHYFTLKKNNIVKGKCKYCGVKISGVFE